MIDQLLEARKWLNIAKIEYDIDWVYHANSYEEDEEGYRPRDDRWIELRGERWDISFHADNTENECILLCLNPKNGDISVVDITDRNFKEVIEEVKIYITTQPKISQQQGEKMSANPEQVKTWWETIKGWIDKVLGTGK